MQMPFLPTDRRKSDDRRVVSDRRRGADNRFVVLEVDATHLRMAVVVCSTGAERPLLVTRTVSWRNNASSLMTPVGVGELSEAIKLLASEERLGGSEAVVLLPSPLCVTRTATSSTTTIDKQVKELEERSQFYLTLGGGQLAMATRRYQLDARHEHALLSVANQRIVEAAAEACHDAGLQLKRIESSTVALSRLHSVLHPDEESPALLVSLNEHAMVLGVAQQGRLLLEYLPGGEAKPADLPAIIDKHLQRMQRFCARKHLGQADSIQRIYLCGSEDLTRDSSRAFGDHAPLNIQVLAVDRIEEMWDTRGAPPEPTLAAALGGAAFKAGGELVLEGPNLLEKWIRESRKHQRPMLLRSAAPLAAVLLIALGILALNMSLGMSNNQLNKRIAAGEPAMGRYNALRLELLAAEANLRSLGQLQNGLPGADLHEMVQRIGQCLPNDVWLERFSVADGTEGSLFGAGYTETGVYEFVGNLEVAPGASSVALQETGIQQQAEGPVTRFSLTATIGAQSIPALGPEGNHE